MQGNYINLDDVNLFDELKESFPDDKESVLKNLSLQLFDTKTPEEVFKIYENFSDDPYAEEICLILKFLQWNMHQSYEDPRIMPLIDHLMSKF